jgi:hypothetical protein
MKTVLFVHAQMVFKCLACLLQEKYNNKFFLASLKTLTDSENCSEKKPHKISVLASVADPDPGSGAFLTPGSGIRDG